MSKGNSSEAENLEPGVELEVISGNAEVTSQDNIEAILEDMQKENAGQSSAPPPPVEEEAGKSSEAPPEAEAISIDDLPFDPPIEPMSVTFTMEDVLRAASESSSMSVEEIRQLDETPREVISIAEPDVVSEAPKPKIEPEPTEDDEDAARAKSKFKLPAFSLAGLSLPKFKSWMSVSTISVAASTVAIGGFLGFAVVQNKHSISKLAARQTASENVLKSIESTLTVSSDRLARIDKALTDGRLQTKHTGKATAKTAKPHDSAKPISKNSEHLGESVKASHAKANVKHPSPAGSEDHGQSKAKSTKTQKPKSSQYVEGFESGHFVTTKPNSAHAPSRPRTKPKAVRVKRRSHPKRAAHAKFKPIRANSVRVYLHGQRVAPGK